MKNIILFIALAFSVTAFAAADTKKVCNIVKEVKTGKQKEVCKTIKVHKKLEGTDISSVKKSK